MKLISKAQTLKKIRLKKSTVPKLHVFKVKEYQKKNDGILDHIQKKFSSYVAVRSSNSSEDNKKKSFAGYFNSYLNVEVQNREKLKNKIKNVIASYKKYSNPKNEVFIQEMVKDVILSGVCTTCDPRTSSPYTIIEFNKGKDTSIVTGGKSNTYSLKYINTQKLKTKNQKILNLIKSVEEIKNIFENKNLEIEFAIDKKEIIYILQIRYLIVSNDFKEITKKQLLISLNKLEKKIDKLQKKHFDIFGKTNYFGVMPDWNPAEIIGTKPKTLSLSLYQELITNSVWANQRFNYGYRDITNNHLMTTFFGTPFVDIRIDFNSWIPNSLSEKIAEKLVNFYLVKLKKNKNLHDKIEFEIIYSSYNFSTEKKIKELVKYKFSNDEIKKIIFDLKKFNFISINKIEEDLNKINKFKNQILKISNSKLHPIDKIYWLLEGCKKFGTLPFAGLARCAFISIDILNSMVEENIVDIGFKNNFLESLKTITNDIKHDFNNLNKTKFLKKYGHLRPNTYEINSLNYKDGYSQYFQKQSKHKSHNINKAKSIVKLNKSQKDKISVFLKKNNLDLNINQFFDFLKNSIEYREYAKFVFTKSIDEIFKSITILGKKLNINKNNLSYLNIQYIKELYFNLNNDNLKKEFENIISKNKKQYEYNKNILLPDSIYDKNDIYFYFDHNTKINFITSKKVTSSIVYLEKIKKNNFNKKIICIDQADPGFDFLFSYDIDGLITKYGGANSHMAIRCNELSIPAAIGVGDENFRKIINQNIISLDCETMKIDFIK